MIGMNRVSSAHVTNLQAALPNKIINIIDNLKMWVAVVYNPTSLIGTLTSPE